MGDKKTTDKESECTKENEMCECKKKSGKGKFLLGAALGAIAGAAAGHFISKKAREAEEEEAEEEEEIEEAAKKVEKKIEKDEKETKKSGTAKSDTKKKQFSTALYDPCIFGEKNDKMRL